MRLLLGVLSFPLLSLLSFQACGCEEWPVVAIQTRLSTCHINLEWPSNTGVLDSRPLTLWSLRLPGHTGHAHCTTAFILCGPWRPAVIHIPYPSAPNSCCPGQGKDPPHKASTAGNRPTLGGQMGIFPSLSAG